MDHTQQETGRVYIYIWLQKQVSRGGDGKKDLCAGMFGFGVGGGWGGGEIILEVPMRLLLY